MATALELAILNFKKAETAATQPGNEVDDFAVAALLAIAAALISIAEKMENGVYTYGG